MTIDYYEATEPDMSATEKLLVTVRRIELRLAAIEGHLTAAVEAASKLGGVQRQAPPFDPAAVEAAAETHWAKHGRAPHGALGIVTVGGVATTWRAIDSRLTRSGGGGLVALVRALGMRLDATPLGVIKQAMIAYRQDHGEWPKPVGSEDASPYFDVRPGVARWATIEARLYGGHKASWLTGGWTLARLAAEIDRQEAADASPGVDATPR